MPGLTNDRPGMVYCCPACDSAGCIYHRSGNGNTQAHPERPFRCQECGVTLEYVVERPNKNPRSGGQKTLTGPRWTEAITAHELAARSPEELGLSALGERQVRSHGD